MPPKVGKKKPKKSSDPATPTVSPRHPHDIPLAAAEHTGTPSNDDGAAELQAALADAGQWKAEAQRLSAAGTVAAAEKEQAAQRAKVELAAAVAGVE